MARRAVARRPNQSIRLSLLRRRRATGPAVTYRPVSGARYRLEHHDSLVFEYQGGGNQTADSRPRGPGAPHHRAGADAGVAIGSRSHSTRWRRWRAAIPCLSTRSSPPWGPPGAGPSRRGDALGAQTRPPGHVDGGACRVSPLPVPRAARGWRARGDGVDRFHQLPAGRGRVHGERAGGHGLSRLRQGESSAATRRSRWRASSKYSRSGKRVQADQELEMTASGTRSGVHQSLGWTASWSRRRGPIPAR